MQAIERARFSSGERDSSSERKGPTDSLDQKGVRLRAGRGRSRGSGVRRQRLFAIFAEHEVVRLALFVTAEAECPVLFRKRPVGLAVT